MGKTLYTVGHSTHALESFLGLLALHRIEALCDVRSVPYSQRNPQFNRDSLKGHLKAAGITYVFLGRELGARSDNPACYVDGKVQYNYLVDEPLFQQGVARVRKGIEDYRVALMCAERDPLTCHRTILVCRELREAGLDILHILSDGSIETNDAAERRLMFLLHIHPDMLTSEHDCIERAYDIQGGNIAYEIPSQSSDPDSRRLADENLHNRLYE
jgi:uncharacterized protein (DUF488 family)